MKATEVTNSEYRDFLNDLKAQGRVEELQKAQVGPESWKNGGAFMQPFVEHYHSHPAYDHYPVVNITREAAQLYCSWLQEKLAAKIGEGAVMVRLPTEKEWEYAAIDGRKNYPYPSGSFQGTGYDIRIDAPDTYAGFTGALPVIGFRPVVSFR